MPVDLGEYEKVNHASFLEFMEYVRPQSFYKSLMWRPLPAILFFVLVSAHVVNAFRTALSVFGWVAATLLGLYISDAFSGVIHVVLDFVEVSLKPPSERSVLEFAAWGFQYHHAHPTNWNESDMWKYGILRSGFTVYLPLAVPHMFALLYFSDNILTFRC